MREARSIFWNLDWVSALLFFALVLMGWLNIYAAAYNEDHASLFDMSQEYGKQLLWIISSVALVVLVLFLDGRLYERLAIPIYLSALVLLAGVLVFGTTISGARSWYTFGGFSLQPSEFMKFATALALAKILTREERDLIKAKDKFLAVVIIAAPILFILPQPDMGSALVYSALIFPLYREGMPSWIIFGLLGMAALFLLSLLLPQIWLISGIAGIALTVAWLFRKIKGLWLWSLLVAAFSVLVVLSVDFAFNELLEDRHRNRINILLGKAEDPKGIGYNTNQSLIAIGSGGLYGKGYLQGTQTKFDFVPEQTTDFIFCTVGEEWGFLGSATVVLLFVILLFRLVFLAERQRSRFSRIYGYSVASILFLHFAVNIAMTVGLAPVIGIPLPFFSYGGSSLWGFTLLLFIFLRLDAYRLLVL
jgi:rod shape determining protein RodA